MNGKDIAKAIIETYDEEQIIDGVIEVLQVAQSLLNPNQLEGSIEFSAGVAINEISHASKILQALRAKKYGSKPINTLG